MANFNSEKSYKSMFAAVVQDGELHYITKLSSEGVILETSTMYNEATFCNPESEKISTADWYFTIRVVNKAKYPELRCFKVWNQVNSGKV